jgi:SAM-dependent methyltransferase
VQTDRQIYIALDELARRHEAPSPGDSGPLTRFELRGFSQHGEDGVIAEILGRIGVGGRFFVEFGVESGREGNCVFLADVLDWGGLFIEADDDAHASLKRKYAANPRVTTVHAAVTPENVESVFEQAGVPAEPDLLSIDIDGGDYWVWDQVRRYRPRVVVIEYNAALAPGQAVVQPSDHRQVWAGTDYFGASLDALSELATSKQYRLVHTDLAAINAFFVRADLAEGRFPAESEVPRRSEPNYFMKGYSHPADDAGRRYVDVRSGATVGDTPRPATQPPPTATDARALAERTDFVWHQRFELAPGVIAPGANNVPFLLDKMGLPDRLDGESVLDIGTTNGGFAFELERRGAGRVLAVDVLDGDHFGFNAIKAVLGSRAEHLQASIYELPGIVAEQFDLVLFLGVLYHLRHPLLALDNVRALTRRLAFIESAVCDAEAPALADTAAARFYRRDELGADPSNWFAPTVSGLSDWCQSCGLEPERVLAWPEGAPSRGMVIARPSAGEPEYQRLSYERPIDATVR